MRSSAFRYAAFIAGSFVLLAAVHAKRVRGAGHRDGRAHDDDRLRPAQPGDKERADAIVVAARKFATIDIPTTARRWRTEHDLRS